MPTYDDWRQWQNDQEAAPELIAFGWAPGDYVQQCRDCVYTHVSAKRSWRCKICAQETKKKCDAVMDTPLICDYDENTGRINW